MGSPDWLLKVAPVTAKTFMKGSISGVMPAAGAAFDFSMNFDNIWAESVNIEGYANFIDTFNKITTIETKVGIISAKTQNLSVGSVDNMTVYYQSEQGTDEIVLVNRVINKIRQMWLQGVLGFGPLVNDVSGKIWADKPADIKKSADNSEYIKQELDTLLSENHLKNDWLFKYYSPEGSGEYWQQPNSVYHNVHGLGQIGRIIANNASTVTFSDPFAAESDRYTMYTYKGLYEKINEIISTLTAIKAKTDKIPDDLLTRLQSIATDASGANVKSGSAEREAKAAHNLLKDEILPKLKECLSRVRSSSAWVLNCICKLVKSCWSPFKECLKQDGAIDVLSDNTTAFNYIYDGPNFGVSGNMQGENPPGYTFACTDIERPLPYWPLSVTDADATNFRSVIQDLPQAVSAYYWPSAYESRD